MNEVASLGFLLSVFAYASLTFLLFKRWRGQFAGGAFVFASGVNFLWSCGAYYLTLHSSPDSVFLSFLDATRMGVWLVFLVILLKARGVLLELISVSSVLLGLAAVAFIYLYVVSAYYLFDFSDVALHDSHQLRVGCLLILSVLGLVFVEQLFRNTPPGARWSIKFLCVAIGGFFAYDFYLYSDALLLQRVDFDIWASQGYVNALMMPLLAISAARNREWALDVHVSRQFVFHSTSVLILGGYLLAMAVGGYYLKTYGGDWGAILYRTFIFAVSILLLLLVFSSHIRTKLKMFISKHFYQYKYDYRKEWLSITDAMSGDQATQQLRLNSIKAVARIVDSPAGTLWLRNEYGEYYEAANWNTVATNLTIARDSQLLTYIQQQRTVLQANRRSKMPESEINQALSQWLDVCPQVWIIVPLFGRGQLYGCIGLTEPRSPVEIEWEDRDLLLTAARQITSYLALLDVNEALVNARQFEAFNRMSAYVVHDLKNIASQLSLVAVNSVKHKKNPAFIDDALSTVENATDKMNRLLGHLRRSRLDISAQQDRVNLVALIAEAIERRGVDAPVPKLICKEEEILVLADYDRLLSAIEHIIQNAQDATPDTGYVNVICSLENDQVCVDIEDSGSGMDDVFIKERLFKPFQTTKGNAGMGIGVYESQDYISAMLGSLTVRSAVNKGTTFTIKLTIAGAG